MIAIDAIAFDYGRVLSGPQDPACVARMLRLTGLAPAEFESHYRAERLPYDRGTLSAENYWANLLHAIGKAPDAGLVAELVEADTESWMGTDQRVIRWAARIAETGKGIAILSNMPENVRAPLTERHASWLSRFPVRIYSCDVGCAKPDAEIYELLLSRLGVHADRVLFIDDNAANVDGARQAGLRTIHYTGIDALEAGLLTEMGLPVF